MSYSRNNPSTPKIREVAIKSVDVVNHSASAVNRFSSTNVDNINNPGNQVFIDTSYYVGATQVQPAPGEQWMIQQINGQWRLHSRISYNDPNQQIEPTAGQHIVGSGNGPVELQGSQINVGGPLAVAAYTTATLPSASSVPAGTHVYDTSLGMPVWSNGTLWTDASGTPLPTLVAPAGIPSTEAFGIPTIGLSVLPSGIASAAALGTPTVTPGPVNISPTGIATGEAFGTPTVFLAPTFDAVGVGGNNNGTSNPGLSFSHTIAGNGILIWFVYVATNGTPTFSVTVGGTAASLLKKYVYVTNVEIDVYQLLSPPTGTKTIVVTPSGDSGANTSFITGDSVSYNHVNSWGTPVTATGSGTSSVSIPVPSAAGQMVSAGFGVDAAVVFTWSAANQTVRYNQASTNTIEPILVQDAAGASSVTFSATKSGDTSTWGAIGIPIV